MDSNVSESACQREDDVSRPHISHFVPQNQDDVFRIFAYTFRKESWENLSSKNFSFVLKCQKNSNIPKKSFYS